MPPQCPDIYDNRTSDTAKGDFFVFFVCMTSMNSKISKKKVLAKVAKAGDIRPGLFEKHVLFFTMLFFSESNYL